MKIKTYIAIISTLFALTLTTNALSQEFWMGNNVECGDLIDGLYITFRYNNKCYMIENTFGNQKSFDSAVTYCEDLELYDTQKVWFLPSEDELKYIYTLDNDGGFNNQQEYWSSTEDALDKNKARYIVGGSTASEPKTTTYRAKCVRIFNP